MTESLDAMSFAMPEPKSVRRSGMFVAGVGMAFTLLLGGCGNPFAVPLPQGRQIVLLERGNPPSPFVSGNYCGYGARHGDLSAKPADQLDAACLAHDVCYISGEDHCACNKALKKTALAIESDEKADAALRSRARSIGRFYTVQFCKVFPHGLLPPRQKGVLATRYGMGAQ